MAMNNSLAEVRPELVPEWSEKNLPLKPDEITFGSNKKVWWRGACGHEWQTSVKARSNGEKCPICSGARVIAGINDLATLEPLLEKQWSEKNKIKPTEVSIGCIIPEGMHGGWQTSGTVKVCHLAFNLWNGFTEEGMPSEGRFHAEYDSERSYSKEELAQMFASVEWQADTMGASLLMPRRIIENALAKYNQSNPIRVYGDNTITSKDKAVIRRMAAYIGVSYTALVIRLRDMGLFEYHNILEYISNELNLGGVSQ